MLNKILHDENERIEFIKRIAEEQIIELKAMKERSKYEIKFSEANNFPEEI